MHTSHHSKLKCVMSMHVHSKNDSAPAGSFHQQLLQQSEVLSFAAMALPPAHGCDNAKTMSLLNQDVLAIDPKMNIGII